MIPDRDEDPIGYLKAERDKLEERIATLEKEMVVLKAIIARQLTGEDIDA